MNPSGWLRRGIRLWIVGAAVAAVCGSGRAADDAERFLQALRDHGYFDTAVEYLDAARNDPRVSKEFKDRVDFEAGHLLLTNSQGRPLSQREPMLAKAKERLDKFVAEHGKTALGDTARRYLADLLVERGKIKVNQSAQTSKKPEEKAALLTDARNLYLEADKVFAGLEKAAYDELTKMPKTGLTPEQTARQDQLRRDLLETRLALANLGYEVAQTYPANAKERKDYLTASTTKLEEFHKKYEAILAGLYARMWQARNLKELGDSAKALKILEELFNGPDEPEGYRILKNKVTALALEIATSPQVKKYAQAVLMAKAWEDKARGIEESSPEGLAIKFLAGQGALEHAKALKDDSKEGKARREHIAAAKNFLKYVSRFPGEYKSKAAALLKDPLLDAGGSGDKDAEPKNYAEAMERAQNALASLTKLEEEEAPPDGKKEEAEQAIAEARQEALKYHRMALEMAPKNIELDDLNRLRYHLAYLYWATESFPEAVVMGEFLARRYPAASGGKSGAKIAVAAYVKLGAGEPGHEFETQRMTALAEYVASRWAEDPDAASNWMMLIQIAIRQRDLPKALEYLAKIPEKNAKRSDAELATGQALWTAYLLAMRQEAADRPKQEELDKLVAQAQKTLEDGITRMQTSGGGTMTYPLAASVLSLAQIYIETGAADKAVRWLDDPKVGVVKLVNDNDPVTQRANFAVEVYKAALRAYVAAQQLEKAEQTMTRLEKLVKDEGDADASRRLTQIYIRLGRELQEQLEMLRKANKTAEVKKVSEGFELFLTKILQRDKGNNFNSLNWVAETFFGLGSGFDVGGKLSDEAKGYYEKSAASYQKILDRLEEPDFGAPQNAVYSVKIRLARVYRRLEEYQKAMKLLYAILKEKPLMIDAQVEAAQTYQAWGALKPGYYELAITGSKEYKEIWGWGALARKLQGVMAQQKEYEKVFFEARYSLAECRFKHAMAEQGDRKTKLLEQAFKDILVLFKLYPELGGKEWQEKFDKLLRDVQKQRGEKATGLEALRKAEEETKKAEAK